MNISRAKEIVSSPVMVNVTFNGDPIYIESVNGGDMTADIHPLDQPERRQRVSLSNLIER